MKRAIYPLIVLLTKSTILLCQGVYFKTTADLNISSTTQKMPEYLSYQINILIPTRPIETYNVNLSVSDFSIATGVNFQCVTGYSFNDLLSFELSFSTFSNSKKEFQASPEIKYAANGKTDWDLRYYSLIPAILFGHSFEKSAVNISFFSGFGYSNLSVKASFNEEFRDYKFDGRGIFSWGYGLEYSYSISKKFSLLTNIGFNNSYYKPKSAKLVSYYPVQYMSTSQNRIQYVEDITNLELNYNGSANPDDPEIRLKETLKLNSIFCGVGLKYTLKY